MNVSYAKRMNLLRASEVRELLKATENPDVIAFAGGLPAPELFPVEEIKKAASLVLDEDGAAALQYSTTEGYLPLRQWIAGRMNDTQGTSFDPDNILITSGSQQGLDFSGKIFLDEGDVVLCESPTYMAALNAFRAYACRFIEVPTDEHGMQPEPLEEILKTTDKVKIIYVIPNFQNPTGCSWSLERRKELARLAAAYQVVVVEDNPYGELRFEGEALPSVKSFDQDENVICLGTFSKIFCPGYRIGWAAGPKDIISRYALVKQGADLHCNSLAQREIAKYLELYDIDEHIEKIRIVYKKRRDLMLQMMAEYFPENVSFTHPEGGLFIWATLPEGWDASDLLKKALEQNITFVPGASFFPNGGNKNTMRLNFSNMPEEKIITGLKRLGKILSEYKNS